MIIGFQSMSYRSCAPSKIRDGFSPLGNSSCTFVKFLTLGCFCIATLVQSLFVKKELSFSKWTVYFVAFTKGSTIYIVDLQFLELYRSSGFEKTPNWDRRIWQAENRRTWSTGAVQRGGTSKITVCVFLSKWVLVFLNCNCNFRFLVSKSRPFCLNVPPKRWNSFVQHLVGKRACLSVWSLLSTFHFYCLHLTFYGRQMMLV